MHNNKMFYANHVPWSLFKLKIWAHTILDSILECAPICRYIEVSSRPSWWWQYLPAPTVAPASHAAHTPTHTVATPVIVVIVTPHICSDDTSLEVSVEVSGELVPC